MHLTNYFVNCDSWVKKCDLVSLIRLKNNVTLDCVHTTRIRTRTIPNFENILKNTLHLVTTAFFPVNFIIIVSTQWFWSFDFWRRKKKLCLFYWTFVDLKKRKKKQKLTRKNGTKSKLHFNRCKWWAGFTYIPIPKSDEADVRTQTTC